MAERHFHPLVHQRDPGISALLIGLLWYFQRFLSIFRTALELIFIHFRYQVSQTRTGMGQVILLSVVSIFCSLVVDERLEQTPHVVNADSLRHVTILLSPLPSDFTGGLTTHIVWIMIIWSRVCTLVLLVYSRWGITGNKEKNTINFWGVIQWIKFFSADLTAMSYKSRQKR